MIWKNKFLFVFLLFLIFITKTGKAHDLPPGFAAIQIAEGLDPVCMTLAPDGRIFFTEKKGRVRIVENGQILLDPFIEIEVDNFNERGLSGIAVDPDFSNSPYVYLYYTVVGANHNRLSRFLAEGNFAVPNSEEILLEFDTLAGNNHNAGAMAFADDGTLFIATGDGRKIEAAQQLNSLLGKILRIHKDGSIPIDNPFYNEASGKYRAIWSLGHRNPFALYYESGTGRLFSTDVGNYRAEEINEVFKGKNYGWPALEGHHQDQVPPANYIPPIHVYDHDDGCAAVGVTTYNPPNKSFPSEYWDKIFFSDYCNGKIMTLDTTTGQIEDFAKNIDRPLSPLIVPDGSMYFLARAGFGDGSAEDNTATNTGSLWRIIYTGSDAPFIAVQPKSILISAGENAYFNTAVHGAEPMQFRWQMDGMDLNAPNSPSLIFNDAALADSGKMVRCIVFNSEGVDTTENATLHVTSNQRPILNILQPDDDFFYKAGEILFFAGEASDPEEGIIPHSNFTWKIDFHHDQHTHPAYGPVSGIEGDGFHISKNGETADNVWFRINFSATDSEGLTQTTQRLVYPMKSIITLNTSPPGLPVFANNELSYAPLPMASVVGIVHDFDVPLTAVTTDSVYVFKNWNTGEIKTDIQFEAPENDFTLTAHYEATQALSDGQGLTGTYYDDPLKVRWFPLDFIMRRIDPTVNFDWDLGSPNEEYMGVDHFLVRWEGYIKPVVSDTFDLHLISNDGSRLWIDDQLLINAWFDQGTEEHSGRMYLEEGNYYPIKIDFYEWIGYASCQLLWSSPKVERSIVPASQLFPAIPTPPFNGDQLEVKLFPNPVGDKLTLDFGSPKSTEINVAIFNANGQLVYSENKSIPRGYSKTELSFKGFVNGVYFVKLTGNLISRTYEIIHQQ